MRSSAIGLREEGARERPARLPSTSGSNPVSSSITDSFYALPRNRREQGPLPAMPVAAGAAWLHDVGTCLRGPRAVGRALALAAVCAMSVPREVRAMAVDGALLTNLVSSTYNGIGGVGSAYFVTYAATATVLIACPAVAIVKASDVTVQNTGGTVTFTVCVVNSSVSASALNVQLTDRLPDNTTFLGPYSYYGAPVPSPYYSTTNGPSWTAGTPANGAAAPLYLRWVFSVVGLNRSTCVVYAVKIL